MFNMPKNCMNLKMRKIEKLIANMHDEEEYVIHIRNLKQASCCGLVLKKVHRAIKFNEKVG